MADDKRDVVDDEDAAARTAAGEAAGLPLRWNNGASGESFGQQRMIQKPTLQQVELMTNAKVRTCGGCKHFRQHHFGQIAGPFMAKLIHEYQWNPKYLGDSPDKMGRCAESEELVVGPNSLACSHYNEKK